ncbi:STAS/SEC14 domain-containing protein [Pontibacter sp. HSC-14F20]|uniref:STAS/SEC14 domain-containing protein n=1 Tax=Pontibacter sp. HSC-14F20 TaxID=2864136 RepID=UPI001C72AB42|nr:STAS/SEC14 domain-containing protein [Pontibacter sp. HSC-14F20]MBX0334370.1 STAS/SEC14 domain-containing protein [Pontibacter sp. HSC-14F20]
MQVYFQNSFVKLSYDKHLKLGKAEWRGRLHGAELREAYLLCHELINRFSLVRWLADDRLMGTISPADLKWSLEVHVPRMAKSHLKRLARIPSKFEVNREAVGVMINKGYTFDVPLEIRDFEDENEAMDWLLEPAQVSATASSC